MSFVGMPITTTSFPSIGSLLGSTGHQAMIDSINQTLGSKDFFGGPKDFAANVRHVFVNEIIAPIKATSAKLQKAVTAMLRPDVIRPLTSLADFQHIPPSMHLPILFFEPIRKLHDQGRVQGFGYDPKVFEGQEDVYGRILDNGHIEDVLDAEADEDGFCTLSYTWDSDDPDLSEEEEESIRETRSFIREILETTKLDPTDPSEERA